VTFVAANVTINIRNKDRRFAIWEGRNIEVRTIRSICLFCYRFDLIISLTFLSTTNLIATKVNYYTPKFVERNAMQYASIRVSTSRY